MFGVFYKCSLSCNAFSFIKSKYEKILLVKYQQIARCIYNTQPTKAFDIAIIGGGMVGTTLACALANNRRLEHKKILLLEENNNYKFEYNNQYSNRVVALNKNSKLLLSSIGAWKHIESIRFTPVYKMQVWDACSDAIITFNENNQFNELACVVENDLLLHAVNIELSKKKNVTVINNVKVKQIFLSQEAGFNSKIHLESGEKFIAKLLIGADGQKSKVRETMGVQYINWEYNQMAIVATVKLLETIKNNVAWQRFLPTGTIALLPLTNSTSSLVWCMSTSEAKRLLQVSEQEFIDNMNYAFCKVYQKNNIIKDGLKIVEILMTKFQIQNKMLRQLQPSIVNIVEGSRAAFPLGFGHAVRYVQPGVVLIGDSAHRVNPLAGQGINLGFGDIKILVELLVEGVNNGALIDDMLYLQKYESIRQKHNIPTLLTIDVLQRLYQETASPIIFTRGLGLQLANAISPIKNYLIQYAADSENRLFR